MVQTQARSRAARTPNRKQQILESAADQFRRSGYHNVGLNEIADTVGLTGPAIYRHFRGKQDLLEATIEDLAEQYVAAYRVEGDSLRDMLAVLTGVAVERRHAGVLWLREARHLPREKRRELGDKFLLTVEPLRAKIAEARPELPPEDVDLLMWACQTVFASVGYHSVKLDADRMRRLLVEVAATICESPRFDEDSLDTGPSRMPVGRLLPASRREAAMVAASRLFAARGYRAVSMDDIGAAAGIAGPSLYHHFPGKSAILIAQLVRCLDAMMFDVSAALELADTPGEALEFLLQAAVRTNIEHGVVMGALLHEMVNVPTDERQGLRRSQRDYIAEWVALLIGSRPELDAPEAELLVHTTHTVIGLLTRQPQTRQRPRLAGELVALGRATLGVTIPDA